jgi:hypothetical protein
MTTMHDPLPLIHVTPETRGKVVTYDPTTGAPAGYAVIQGCAETQANIRGWQNEPMMIRAWVRGANPRTPSQQARRAIHAAAVAAWQADPDGCRTIARPEARARRIGDFMAWCAIYHRAHSASTPVVWDQQQAPWDESWDTWDSTDSSWDAGAATWDAGATLWDHADPSTWDNDLTRWDYNAPSTWDEGTTHWDYTAASLWDAGSTIWQT